MTDLVQDGRAGPDEEPGLEATPRSAGARADLEAAIEAAREQGEALASDIRVMVTSAAQSEDRIRDLERSLASAVMARDDALEQIGEIEMRLEATEDGERTAAGDLAACYEASLREARERLAQQATAKLRTRAAELKVQAETYLSERESQLERRIQAEVERRLREREAEINFSRSLEADRRELEAPGLGRFRAAGRAGSSSG